MRAANRGVAERMVISPCDAHAGAALTPGERRFNPAIGRANYATLPTADGEAYVGFSQKWTICREIIPWVSENLSACVIFDAGFVCMAALRRIDARALAYSDQENTEIPSELTIKQRFHCGIGRFSFNLASFG